jgi:dTDP-4-amino-4,6-dideoxygalactose transaminase
MSRFRLVPPAGAPLPARSVLPALFPDAGGRGSVAKLLGEHLGVQNPAFVSSGRAALAILLNELRQCSDRREVVIPAYTCFSVPSAVARTGLTIRLCDVDPKTLDLDLNALLGLDLDKALCIVPSGLYGLPGDLVAMEGISRTAGAFLVDDAAQCLGATQAGRACGSFGDAGFYSLGRGKGITTMGGGILVTHRKDIAPGIARAVRDLREPSAWAIGVAAGSSLVYSAMLKPSRYWLLDHVPFLELGGSTFKPGFPIARLSDYQARLGAQLLPRLQSYNEIRRHHAEQLRAGIEGVEGIEMPRPVDGSRPVYLRFPILVRDGAYRSHLLRQLRNAGIGASPSYPTSVGDIPGIEPYLARRQEACPGAREIAERILTLPTHPGVTPRDIEVMVAIIRGDQGRASEALR